jgi:hypothetical protein
VATHNCENCGFRKKYENNPKSLVSRIWRWHALWCPGWRIYMNSLAAEERRKVAERYNMGRYFKR